MSVRYGAAPVFYGSNYRTVHLGMTRSAVYTDPAVRIPLDNSGLCWRGRSDRYPVTLSLAEGVSVNCAECIEEANRRQAAKEARDGTGLERQRADRA